jgi:ABC-2 type transport system permease protein
MMRAFVLAELRARRRMVAGLGAGAYSLLLIMGLAYQSIGVRGLGGTFGSRQPRAISAFSGSPDGNFLSPHGWMGFGFNHPMFLVVTLTVGISVGAGAIAGEVDSGRAELLFTAPVTRTRFLLASFVVWVAAELAVLVAGWAGAMTGALFSSDLRHAGIGVLAWAPVQYLPLALFVAACAFAASASSPTRGRATAVTVGIVVLAYLLNVVSGLIGSLAWLRWLTPFGYYDPAAALAHGPRPWPAVALLAASGALLALTRAQLLRRDLA